MNEKMSIFIQNGSPFYWQQVHNQGNKKSHKKRGIKVINLELFKNSNR